MTIKIMSVSQLRTPDGMAQPSAEFNTVVVLSPRSETLWERVKRFFFRRGRIQPRSRRPRTLSRRQAEMAAREFGAQSPHSGAFPTPNRAGSGQRFRGLTRTSSQTSIHDTPVLRDELDGAWPRLKINALSPDSRSGSSKRTSLRRSGSDTYLAMALGSGVGVDDLDYVSELGTVSEAAATNGGKPYPWMDTPVEGLDSWMMY